MCISVTNFYNRQKTLFESATILLERKTNSANLKRQEDAAMAKVEAINAKLQQKNEGIQKGRETQNHD